MVGLVSVIVTLVSSLPSTTAVTVEASPTPPVPTLYVANSNSIIAFDGRAEVVARYDKWRLVPGGEFLPFEWLLEPLGFRKAHVGRRGEVVRPQRDRQFPPCIGRPGIGKHLLPGGGDELQGIKKGIMELADSLLINKADGDNIPAAENAAAGSSTAESRCPAPPKSANRASPGASRQERPKPAGRRLVANCRLIGSYRGVGEETRTPGLRNHNPAL